MQRLKESGASTQLSNSLTEDSKDQLLLIKLVGKQITDWWDKVWYVMKSALPQEVDEPGLDIENNILSSAIKGDLEIYFVMRGDEFIGVLAIKEEVEYISGTKNLLIYALAGVKPLTMEDWIVGLKELNKIARIKLCSNIIAQTTNHQIIDTIKALGGQASWTLIKMGVTWNV